MDELAGVYGEIERLFEFATPRTGREIALALAKQFGGGQVYFSTLRRLTMSERNERIRKEFTGNNLPDLMRRYQLSSGRIRDIIAKGKKAEKAEKKGKGSGQLSLFDL